MTDIGGDFLALRQYLAGELPANELRAIEERLERDPQLVRELELHLRMREGLVQVVQAQRAHGRAATRRRDFRTWSSGLAAAAGCAGIAFLLWGQQGTPAPSMLQPTAQPSPATAAPTAVTARFTFVPVRGTSRPELELPASGLIELRAAPGPERSTPYRVTLARQDAPDRPQPLGTLAAVTAGTDGYLHYYVEASRLAPGDYLLRVEPQASAAAPGEVFQFRLRAAAH